MSPRLLRRVVPDRLVDSITIDRIPQDYRNLVVVFIGAGGSGDTLLVRFNDDAGSGQYGYAIMYNNSTTPTAANSASATSIQAGIIPASGTSGGVLRLWVPEYASTVWYKTALIHNGSEQRATFGTGIYRSLLPLTSVTVTTSTPSSLIVGSSLAVYVEP